jgi:PBP1b-binding outer membrane lipoprotein LpoB
MFAMQKSMGKSCKNSFLLPTRTSCLVGIFFAVAFLVGGCASGGVKNPSGVPVTRFNPDEQGFVGGTGIESTELVAVADKMARSIIGIPQIVNAATPPVIIIDPVDNQTRFPINKDIFLTRIRAELNHQAVGKVSFLARDRMGVIQKELTLKQQGQVTSSSDPNVQEFKGADFILTGELQGLSTRTSQGTSDYILYDFHLIDVRTTAIIWEDTAEVKKQGLEDAAYR